MMSGDGKRSVEGVVCRRVHLVLEVLSYLWGRLGEGGGVFLG